MISDDNFISQINQSRVGDGDNEKKEVINDYVVDKNLGGGSFGSVKLCYSISDKNKKYAMKIVKRQSKKVMRAPSGRGKKSDSDLPDGYKEVAIMKKINHPNIMKLYEVIDDEKNNKLYLSFFFFFFKKK
jgi:[calcium/calmodulin-dependent protein kinase] kinase